MLNSGMKLHSFNKVLPGYSFVKGKFKLSGVYHMNEQFHGIDLHKRYATINVRDNNGKEVQFISRCTYFQEYIDTLGEKDFVVIESINNAFYWADQIEKQGAKCVIVNPHKFKIIKESWNKTDKRDASNLSLALWMSV